jgi:hypothetical protein
VRFLSMMKLLWGCHCGGGVFRGEFVVRALCLISGASGSPDRSPFDTPWRAVKRLMPFVVRQSNHERRETATSEVP